VASPERWTLNRRPIQRLDGHWRPIAIIAAGQRATSATQPRGALPLTSILPVRRLAGSLLMFTVCRPSVFGLASRDATAALSRGRYRVTIEPSAFQQRSTDAAIATARAARWCDVESVARDGDSQHSGGSLSTVWDGVLAIRLDRDATIDAVDPFAQVGAGEALPSLTPSESVHDWGASWVAVGSPARGERPPPAHLSRH
jgi:hypothetical protein